MKITYELLYLDASHFVTSRLALKNLLSLEQIEITDLKEELKLLNFQKIEKFPEYLTSISHTKNLGGALLCRASDYKSIGFDIEWADRKMKPEISVFYYNDKDTYEPDDLKRWTMKEAAFKALSPLGYNGVLVLSKIIIQDGIFFTEKHPEIMGTVTFETIDVTIEDGQKRRVYLAIASIKNN